MKKLIASILTGALLIMATNAMATSVSVTYDLNYLGVTGSFSGDDANNNGLLEFSELATWTSTYAGGYTLSSLNDFGDFNYLSNLWIPNALQWDQATHDAYMTWDNWGLSVSTSNYNWDIDTNVTTSSTSVPEPSTILLLGAGIAGVGFLRRKKKM